MKQWQTKSHSLLRLPLRVYLAYLLVCTFLATGVSFSRYSSTSGGTDSARVAQGVFHVDWTGGSSGLTLQPEGTAEYKFTVSNQENGIASEVTVGYDVIVQFEPALPEGVTVQLDGHNATQSSSDKMHYTFSDVKVLPAGTGTSAEHTLTFTANSTAFTAESLQITVIVQAEQID